MSFAHSGKSLHVLFSPQMGHIPSLHHILARNSSCASVLFPENSHLDYFMLIEQFRALLILIVQTYDIHLFYAVRQKWSFQSLWPLGNFLCRTSLCGKAAEGCPLEQNHSLSAPPALIPCRCNCTGTEVMVFDLFQGAGKMQPSSQTKGRALAGHLQLPSAGHRMTACDVRWQKMCSEGIWEVKYLLVPCAHFCLLARAVVSQAWVFACLLS